MTQITQPTPIYSGLIFPEGLIWHNGELWFSDFGARRVLSMTADGAITQQAYVVGQPSGLGFLPDGTPIVASMVDRLILRLDGGEHPSLHADASSACLGQMNDIIIDDHGRTFFGSFGYDPSYEGGDAVRPSTLGLATADGEVRTVADDLQFPNGMAITADGATLVVSETFASRLTAFTIRNDGSLDDRRVFAELGELAADGICMDAEGAIWAACPFAEQFVRVAEGGDILERVPTPGRWAVTCSLGGDDGTTLFCATAKTTLPDFHQGRSEGAIETTRVDVPGPGHA
jgi:sugar lactone lactonase YvrE